MDCIHLAQNGDQWWALMNMVMNVRVPQNVGELLGSWATGGFPRTWLYAVSLESIIAYINLFLSWLFCDAVSIETVYSRCQDEYWIWSSWWNENSCLLLSHYHTTYSTPHSMVIFCCILWSICQTENLSNINCQSEKGD
jgi:hypothetical protein